MKEYSSSGTTKREVCEWGLSCCYLTLGDFSGKAYSVRQDPSIVTQPYSTCKCHKEHIRSSEKPLPVLQLLGRSAGDIIGAPKNGFC